MTVISSDVAIIGGGISGISCAYHLLKQPDFTGNVVLIEARDRLGGRIAGYKIAGTHVELGANWIHGLEDNPIYELALRYKLLEEDLNVSSKDDFETLHVRTSDGKQVYLSLIQKIYEKYVLMLKECEKFYHNRDSDNLRTNSLQSVGEWLETKISIYLEDVPEKKHSLYRAIFENLMNRETVISSCNSLDDLSLPYFGAYKELPGGNVTIPGGYQKVIDGLINEIQTSAATDRFKILLNHPVSLIDWEDQGGVTIKSANSSNIVRCSRAVVTIPLGVLKTNYKKMFSPPLPREKSVAIEKLGFGTVDKIFLEYSVALDNFFPAPETYTLWLPGDKAEGKWATKIYSITKVNRCCLLVWLSGIEAIQAEKLSDLEVGRHLTKVFRKFVANPLLPEPVNVVVTKWGSDPFSQGSYTFIAQDSAVMDIENLETPLCPQGKPTIIFAGEACHRYFFSTVHGGFLSGRKAALTIREYDGSEQNSKDLKNFVRKSRMSEKSRAEGQATRSFSQVRDDKKKGRRRIKSEEFPQLGKTSDSN